MKKLFFSYVIFLNGLMAFCQNPLLLKDVSPGNNSGTIANIVKTSNYTFFNENDGGAATDRSLYRTDGTPGGTIKLNLTYLPDPPPSPNNYISTKAEKLTALGNKVIFAGDNAAYYGEIWSSDGTQAGTIAIERFQPTINNQAPVYELAEMNGYVYYGVTATNNKTQIRRTDGTIGGTSLVYEFSSYSTAPETGLFKVINGILYFNLYDSNGTGFDQLWRCDGTAAGTYMLKDFGAGQYVASWYMPAKSGLFYWMIVKPGTGNVLWKSDGTIAGTASVKTIGTTGNNNYPQFAATIGDNIAFAGLDGNGRELWTTDGTDSGTNMVADINTGSANSNPSGLIFWNGLLYFSAFKADSGTELWKSDGSSSGTILVKDINPGTANSSPGSMVLSNNTILFIATTATEGSELWLTDGTAANTAIVADMNLGAGGAFPNLLTPGNPVFFAANNGTSGFEVFKYNNSEGILGVKNVWLTGAAFGEWKQEGVIKMTNNGGGIFTATNIQIIGTGGESSYFKFTEGTWASAAGRSLTTPAPGFPTGVTELSSVTEPQGVDNVITGTPGFWNVTYNYVTKAYSFTPTPLDNWGVVGTATPNGWNGPDMPLTYDAISNKWSAVVSLADGEIKFRKNNDWAVNYGDNGADGSLDTNGTNIAITGGRYLITLDFNTLKYTIKSAINDYYVNDNSKTGDVFTSGIGSNNNTGTKAAPFATINYAISKAQNGDTIYVDAGTYTERIFVNKSLSIKGANAGNNPGISLNRGLSESILIPSTENNITEIMTIQAPDVSIDGFIFDGDNPAITGSINLNGIDVNAGMGIYNGNLATNNLIAQNNIFKNFFRYGIFLQRNVVSERLSGINISSNHIDNVSSKTPRDGRGVGFFNNVYGTVTDNYFTRVNTGVIIANYVNGSADSILISSNNIEAYSYGINASSNSNITSPLIIDNNQFTVADLTTWSAPGSSSVNNYIGLGVFNLTSSKNVSINNNVVTGTQTGIYLSSIVSPLGIQVNGGSVSNSSQIGLFYINRGIGAAKLSLNNVSLINNVVGMDASAGDGNNLQLEFSGVTINGGTTGIRFYGLPISLPSNTLTGVSFLNQSKEYILQTVNAFQGQTIDASTVSFDGVTPINMTLVQLFATEDKLTHKIDIDNVGYFKLKPSEVFVTPNSFAADLPPVFGTPTFGPEINRAVGAASTGDVIRLKAGTYINQVNIDKAITIKGEGKELTFIQGPAAPILALPDFAEKGIIQSISGIGDVNIEDLTIDGTNSDEVHSILIQGGGLVANCEMRNANNGFFFRDESGAARVALANNNFIHNINYVGAIFAGNGMQATATNNVIDLNGALYGMGFIAGYGGNGNLASFTATNNSIINFNGFGFSVGSLQTAQIHNNSITRITGNIIGSGAGLQVDASCNWFGTAVASEIAPNITGSVNYTPWLTNGIDSDLVSNGFQPLADVCNGTPVAVILDNSTNVTCNGANNGTINIIASNGLAPYNFLWTNSDNYEFSSSNEDLTNLEPGTYQLLLTDTNGSTASLSNIVISEPSILTATADGINNLCFGESTGTAFVVVDGGTTPYTYLWNNGATTDEISNLSAGTYSVTVTDANGCTINASYEVTQPTLLTASITNNSTACSNNATATSGGGTPGYSFLWSNGATTASIDNVPVGTYTLTVTDANGCSTTASITLTVGEAFNPSASATDVSCFGGSNGAITVTNANGTAPFTFSNDGITFLSGSLPYSFNNLLAGTYNIAVKDANGCTGFVTKTIAQPALLTATLITVQSTCFGQSTGSISVATTGGSGALSYSWTGTGGFTSSQKNINNLAAGSYVLTVTDNNGCTALLDVVVQNFNPITVSETITHVLCRGSLTGAINLTVSGGSGSFAYSWTGNTISTSEDISNLGSGTNYKVTITDIASGCVVTKTYVISQPASNLAISTTKTNSTGCNSLGTITITGSGGTAGYTYSIDGTNYQLANTFSGLQAGSYTAWLKDANGCIKSSALISITDNGSDAYESNNSKNQAKLISIGAIINARIALATDTADWFKFTPTSTGNYKLTITHPTINYTFNLYPSTNNAAALVPTSPTLTSKTYALTGGLTYFVQITGGLSFNCYNLSISTVASAAKYAATNTKVIAVDKLSVKAYPIPHQGLFNLSIISPEEGKAQIELFTILGQLLAKREVTIEKGQNTIVEFNDVGRGIILYHLTIGNQEANGKVYGKD